MLRVRLSLRLVLIGFAAGALVGAVTPSSTLEAYMGCKCDDFGSSDYECSFQQTACEPGDEECHLKCGT